MLGNSIRLNILTHVIVVVCVSSVHSVAYTDGRWLVEWVKNGQDKASEQNLKCFYYDVRNVTPPYTFLDNTTVEMTSTETMTVLVEECADSQNHVVLKHYARWKRSRLALYPGTKWCGKGNVAYDSNDLGKFWKTDICCRQHDTKCPIYIISGETKYNVSNREIYTMSECKCDARFRQCLQSAGTITSNAVGKLFFDFLKIKCLDVPSGYDNDTQVGIIAEVKQPESYYQKNITGITPFGKFITGYFEDNGR